jgi:murein L,D-transpeptidase YcbB/YkuD
MYKAGANIIATLLLALAIVQAFPLSVAAGTLSEQVGEILKKRISEADVDQKVFINGKESHVSGMISAFYERRKFLPAWSNEMNLHQAETAEYPGKGKEPSKTPVKGEYTVVLVPIKQADDLVSAVKGAGNEGLRPYSYREAGMEAALAGMRNAVSKPSSPEIAADMDLMLTDAFLSYGMDLLVGRVNPATIEGEWADYGWEADLPLGLEMALSEDAVKMTLEGLVPPHPGYNLLRQVLASHREMSSAGGWPTVPPGPILRIGNRTGRVRALRARLLVTGDLDPAVGVDEYLFDSDLERAVKRFQWRHGLRPDGLVGSRTLAALNVSIDARIRQVELNMERWRWLPEDFGQHYIFVNSADFNMKVVRDGMTEMTMRVVVGKPYWHTPSFSAVLTYIVLNPSWHVPRSIALHDLLPILRRKPRYIHEQGFKVYEGRRDRVMEIDPGSVNWRKVDEENFGFMFRQMPGPLNPLGRLKFMFPNRFAVYMHATPSSKLFSAEVRAFSHGCLRIERPVELAEHLLRDDPEWTYESLLAAIEEGVEKTVKLPKPINIHLLYWTTWVDEEYGTTMFRKDIYGRDERLEEALLGVD